MKQKTREKEEKKVKKPDLQPVGGFEVLRPLLVEGAAVVEHKHDVRGKGIQGGEGLGVELSSNEIQIDRVFDGIVVVSHLEQFLLSERTSHTREEGKMQWENN